jgi:hypothetical protein
MNKTTGRQADPDSTAPKMLRLIEKAMGVAVHDGCRAECLTLLERAEKQVLMVAMQDASYRVATRHIEKAKKGSRA